jgi:hypothetical protein
MEMRKGNEKGEKERERESCARVLGCWLLGCWMEMKNGTEKGQKERERASCARVLGSWDAGMLGAGWKEKRELRKENKHR